MAARNLSRILPLTRDLSRTNLLFVDTDREGAQMARKWSAAEDWNPWELRSAGDGWELFNNKTRKSTSFDSRDLAADAWDAKTYEALLVLCGEPPFAPGDRVVVKGSPSAAVDVVVTCRPQCDGGYWVTTVGGGYYPQPYPASRFEAA